MCGIIGITNVDDVVNELYAGLIAIQHRGQDACGIHTFNGKVEHKKGRGLVQEVFNEDDLRILKGRSGIGHVRYATVGGGDDDDIQPFYESLYFLASMAHNGNLTNFSDLQGKLGPLASGCDLEGILKVFQSNTINQFFDKHFSKPFSEMKIDMSSDCAVDYVLDSVKAVMQECQGSFSVIANIPGLGMIGFKDPYGIKPLTVAKKSTDKGPAFCFASEDVAFQLPLDYDFIKEIGPGSIFIAREDGSVIEKQLVKDRQTNHSCIFELIYFASQCSMIDGVSVSEYRYNLGKELGLEWLAQGRPKDGEVICASIPSASERGGAGFHETTGIPLRDVFVRNNYMRRGFILPDRRAREFNAALKLPIDFSVLREARHVVLIDDSIVRGDTSRSLVARLKRETAKRNLPLENIYFLSLAPPNMHPCVYGIDMSVDKELIAGKLGSVEAVGNYLGVDHLMYNKLDVLGTVLSRLKGTGNSPYCDACFSGQYPTGICRQDIDRLKKERLADKGSDY